MRSDKQGKGCVGMKENPIILKVLGAKNYDELLERPYKKGKFKKEKLPIYKRFIRGSIRLFYGRIK